MPVCALALRVPRRITVVIARARNATTEGAAGEVERLKIVNKVNSFVSRL
jgi:hypothetical protein